MNGRKRNMRERAPKREDGTKGEDKKSWFQHDDEIKIVKESRRKGRKRGRTKTQSHWKCEYVRGAEVRAKKSRLRERRGGGDAGGWSLHSPVKFGFMLPSRPGEREKKNCMNLKENREPRAPGTNGNKRGGALQCETLTQKV